MIRRGSVFGSVPWPAGLLVGALAFSTGAAFGGIKDTRHNLGSSVSALSRTVKAEAGQSTEVCVFCHTPHAATSGAPPLWNRSLSTADGSYTPYTSSSLDANDNLIDRQPDGGSKLCLSCHDGMMTIGTVGVLSGEVGKTVTMEGTANGKMADGLGPTTGFTRNLGTDLSNDHPISVTFDDGLASRDGELRRPSVNTTLMGVRSPSNKPLLPLQETGASNSPQVQCTTCHDPHKSDIEKFLRLNRFQTNAPPAYNNFDPNLDSFNQDNDQICLACHNKMGRGWAGSAHASSEVADEPYTDAAAALRGFPAGTRVWQAACLNCHDTHTVQGSRRLLREGVGESGLTTDTDPYDGTALAVPSGPAAGQPYQPGSASNPPGQNKRTSSIESTCFQCHGSAVSGNTFAITTANGWVPRIKELFDQRYGMPVATDMQAQPDLSNPVEQHDVSNSDLIEQRGQLGYLTNTSRHAECPDCHNPHRLIRNTKFNRTGDSNNRTHQTGIGMEGNVAAGVLRGGWGVQPIFATDLRTRTWPELPIRYDVKKGDPGTSTSISTDETYLTREYQLCFKCHSDYANGPLMGQSDATSDFPALDYPVTTQPRRRRRHRGTNTASNGMVHYTNVAAEFGSVNATAPPSSGTDQGEQGNTSTTCGGSDCVPNPSNYGDPQWESGDSNSNSEINHRSWHPVLWPTGRSREERRMSSTGTVNILAPFDVSIGSQTMHCSDCHGQASSYERGVGPVSGEPQGPHGSDVPFLLRGVWDLTVTLSGDIDRGDSRGSGASRALCGNCHESGKGRRASGFLSGHRGAASEMDRAYCMTCHIAVPHGWKNKQFLVNLRCVGKEGGETSDCVDRGNNWRATTIPPYYNNAKLEIAGFRRSGNWNTESSSACASGMTSC